MKNTNELEALIDMSRFAGSRFDLVQAGGGNTSVKLNDYMYIKASGYLLSELDENTGYTLVKTADVLAILEDEQILGIKDKKKKDGAASIKLQQAITGDGPRPSIETYLHALLYKYTLHVHSIAINLFTSDKNWTSELTELDETALGVRYETPGIELALELKKQLSIYYSEFSHLPNTIFLQNHGLIISSDSFEEIKQLTEEIVKKAEIKAGVDFSRYRRSTEISNCYKEAYGVTCVAYLTEDAIINQLLKNLDKSVLRRPFSPDGYVFCGYTILEIKLLSPSQFQKYTEIYSEIPKLVLYNDYLYILAGDVKKAKMIEDVFKNNLLISNYLKDKLMYLEDKEIRYLGNWESEKYRQNL